MNFFKGGNRTHGLHSTMKDQLIHFQDSTAPLDSYYNSFERRPKPLRRKPTFPDINHPFNSKLKKIRIDTVSCSSQQVESFLDKGRLDCLVSTSEQPLPSLFEPPRSFEKVERKFDIKYFRSGKHDCEVKFTGGKENDHFYRAASDNLGQKNDLTSCRSQAKKSTENRLVVKEDDQIMGAALTLSFGFLTSPSSTTSSSSNRSL